MTRPDAIEAIVLATSTNETKARGRVRKVTFEIPADGPNPFEGMGGERIHIVCVRLNNDETPVEKAKQIEPPKERKPLATASQIALACQSEAFREFVRLRHCATLQDDLTGCDRWVKDWLQVDSKRDVLPGTKAFEEWTDLYGNFLVWLKYERAA